MGIVVFVVVGWEGACDSEMYYYIFSPSNYPASSNSSRIDVVLNFHLEIECKLPHKPIRVQHWMLMLRSSLLLVSLGGLDIFVHELPQYIEMIVLEGYDVERIFKT